MMTRLNMTGRTQPWRLMLAATALAMPMAAAAAQAGKPTAPNPFLAGAGKADITPPAAELPSGGVIRDHLFARAAVIRAGKSCAVLVGLDQGGTANAVMARALPQVEKITGCPEANIVISATHTHSGGPGGPDGKPDRVADAIVAAVTDATKAMRPARLGFGTTTVDLNSNRDYYDAKGNWVQANNPAGPSDKTLAVLALVGADNLPIALYVDYAMHPVDFYLSRVVSADFAGGASRYLEDRFAGSVAIFAQGASGDQNPRLLGLPNDLMLAGLGAPPLDNHVGARPFWEMSSGGPGGPPPPPPAGGPSAAERYKVAYDRVSAGVDAMAWTIGESAARVVLSPDFRLIEGGSIAGSQASVTCPGRDVRGAINPGGTNRTPAYADGAPVEIKLGALRLGDVTLASVDGEVYTNIWTRLRQQAPAGKLMMVTLANGMANSGYIYTNDAGERRTFQVISSRLKPGCAEDKIVATSLDLIAAAER